MKFEYFFVVLVCIGLPVTLGRTWGKRVFGVIAMTGLCWLAYRS